MYFSWSIIYVCIVYLAFPKVKVIFMKFLANLSLFRDDSPLAKCPIGGNATDGGKSTSWRQIKSIFSSQHRSTVISICVDFWQRKQTSVFFSFACFICPPSRPQASVHLTSTSKAVCSVTCKIFRLHSSWLSDVGRVLWRKIRLHASVLKHSQKK